MLKILAVEIKRSYHPSYHMYAGFHLEIIPTGRNDRFFYEKGDEKRVRSLEQYYTANSIKGVRIRASAPLNETLVCTESLICCFLNRMVV